MKQTFLSILFTFLPLLASAEPVEIDGLWYNFVKKGQVAEVTRNPNVDNLSAWFSGSCNIPASVIYEGVTYNVTSIGWYAFSGCSGLTSVSIPSSVISIGGSAFYGCSELTSVSIPSSVISIGEGAFQYCSGLTSVYISDLKAWCGIEFSDSYIYSYFYYYSNPLFYAHHLYLNGEEIKDLVVPSSVTSIGSSAFYGCSDLTSVTIPNSVTSIGRSAFANCSGLTSVTIPNSVTSIGGFAFSGCSGLTSVTIPNSVTSIGEHAFYGCSGLTSVTIPNSVTNIGSYAFCECRGLTSATIPNNVTTIDKGTFELCRGLTSATIPNSVTSIENYAFANCDDLTDVYCMAEIVPATNFDAFKSTKLQGINLHVPAAAIEAYSTTETWCSFKNIVAIGDGDIPETQRCATPVITYKDGKLSFACETEDAEFVTEITGGAAKTYNDSEITVGSVYTVTVYATKPGYDDSDKATLDITPSSIQGDLTGDGQVDEADHVKLSEIIMKL